MIGDDAVRGRSRRAAGTTLRAAAAVLLLSVLVGVAGIALTAILGRHGDDQTWKRWSDVGQAFGAVNSVISAIAVMALLVTWISQSRDVAAQRRIMEDAQSSLRRSADIDLRKLHVTLTRIAIDRPYLAAVWPSHRRTDAVAQAQHLYANLLLQHARLQHTSGVATRQELISNLRFLFASPLIRAFWRETANSRHSIYVEGTEELGFAALADEIWQEYEAVLACSSTPDSPPSHPQPTGVQPTGVQPTGVQPTGVQPTGAREWVAENLQSGEWSVPQQAADPTVDP